MSAPDSPTGYPKLDPNDRELEIVGAFNRLVDMLEERTPAYYASAAERDAVWGTPGLYDRPQALIGGAWYMWDGTRWATVTNTDGTYSWSPVLYTGNLNPIPNANGVNYSSLCSYLPVSDNLIWLKFSVSFTAAGAKYLTARQDGELIQSSLPPFQLDASYLAGGAALRVGNSMRAASFYSTSAKQIAFAHATGPVCVNSFAWQAGDGIQASGVVSV